MRCDAPAPTPEPVALQRDFPGAHRLCMPVATTNLTDNHRMTRSSSRTSALLAIAGSAILSLIDNYVTMTSQESGLWQFLVFRTAIALPMVFAYAWLFGVDLAPKDVRPILLRSVAVSGGLILYFSALGFLPVAQAGAGLYSAPIWVLLLSWALFGVRIRPLQVLAMALGFAGVLMVLQPNPELLSMATLFPIAAGGFYGLGMLLTRHWCAEESAITLAAGVFVVLGLVSAAMLAILTMWPGLMGVSGFVFRGWTAPTSTFLWLTLGQALGAVIAVSLIAQAYKIGDPASVSVYEYSFLAFAAVWTFLLWGKKIDLLGALGIATILLSGIAMSFAGRAQTARVAVAGRSY